SIRSYPWMRQRLRHTHSSTGPCLRPLLFDRRDIASVDLTTFRCKTQTIDSVFIRGGDVGTRPNAPISLTIGAVIRDREGAARIRSARYAAHAVSLLGGTMVRRAYRQRSLVEVLLPDGDKLWDSTLP